MSDFATLQWLRGYANWFNNLVWYCGQAKRSTITTSIEIPAGDARDILQGDTLFPVEQMGSEITEQQPQFTVYLVYGMMGGQLPVRGLLTIPTGGATRMVTVLHGMVGLPELVMGSPGSDYHNQIGRALAYSGFAVWSPYFPHRGDVPSIAEMHLNLTRGGLSLPAYMTSAIAAGETFYTEHFDQPEPTKRAVYGVSVGVMHAIHASMVLPFDARVLTGYLRYDEMVPINIASAVQTGQLMPHGYNPHSLKSAMPHCFPRMPAVPTFFECGSNDPLASPGLNRDQAFADAQAAWPSLTPSQLVKHIFPGGHQVQGTTSIAWLDANL